MIAAQARPSAGRNAPRTRVVDNRTLLTFAILIAAYVLAAKVGFSAALVAAQVSPVWPPTGVALWAVLVFGTRVWPAIFLGAAIANATTSVAIVPACMIAGGNTLEALAGAWLVRRLGDVDRSLEGLRGVVALIIGSAMISTAISATIGVLTLSLFGVQPWGMFASLWWTWWLGDATGALLIAPLLLTIPIWKRSRDVVAVAVEVFLLEVAAIAISSLVFIVWPSASSGQHRLEYLVFPLVMWAGFRLAHPGAAVVGLTTSCIAVWGTLRGVGPFGLAGATPHESLTLLQIYTAVMSTSGLVFGAAIADRAREERLRDTDHALTAILSQEPVLEGAARRILQGIAETLDWDVGVLWEVDDDEVSLKYVDSWRRNERTDAFISDSRRRRFEQGVGLPGRVWESAQPGWIYDVAVDPNFPRASVATAAGLHGGFAFPILGGTRVLGVMEFFTRESRRPDQSLLELMTAAGSQIGQYMERRRDRRRIDQERTQLLERERAARLDAEAANRAKDEFLATVSHELRTPLTAILGWASMLRSNEYDPARQPEIHERIFRNAQAQAQIVNDLLDVSRIVSGQLRLEWQRVDVGDLARLSVETIRPTATVKGVTLESTIPDTGIGVAGDPARLQQVFWNLLSNAIKFTPAGGTVTLIVGTSDVGAVIAVTDSGIGIPPEFLPRLFERFWQADSTSTRLQGGLGLGLALARHIVEIHGGEIEATSEGEGRGSTFTVRLPMRPATPLPGRESVAISETEVEPQA